jgi:nucleotide-binding universal stress UspA family protein
MTQPINTDAPAGVDEANSILDQAEDIAHSMGVKVKGDLLQARDAGHAIVEESVERGVDLIFMEVKQSACSGMVSLGKTVDYVLKHAPCNVWISRSSATTHT